MTDIVLKDIDPALAERIGRIAQARGWTTPQTLQALLEQGLGSLESRGGLRGRFEAGDAESNVLQAAIAALEGVPNDPGFALIGRVPDAQPAV